jgi:rhodanese-related sulfurtransferase
MKKIVLLIGLFIYSHAVNPIALPFTGVKVEHIYSNNTQENILIERVVNSKCMNVQVSAENFTKKNIERNIPHECKKTIVSTKGVIQPFYINERIKTFGELEVLYFIYSKSSQQRDKYILVDSRTSAWFNSKTIPSSVNIPYEDLKYDEDFEDDFYKAYKNLGVKVTDKNKFDFSNAKTAVFFCNGAWCPISTKSINYLLSIGYPENKMIWYRGGIARWESLSLSLTKKLQ